MIHVQTLCDLTVSMILCLDVCTVIKLLILLRAAFLQLGTMHYTVLRICVIMPLKTIETNESLCSAINYCCCVYLVTSE